MKSDQKINPFKEVIEAEERIESASKSLYHRIINWVKAHPLLTLLFSFLFSVASNLVSSWLWYHFKK